MAVVLMVGASLAIFLWVENFRTVFVMYTAVVVVVRF